eukprot:TRINITY_DN117301_c0_g1_i1.p1 TRINITY_DN117301_c0_g1~~TRINITY_DN117301_c0_g1_i1.p1  ORF type:complete len:136 (+),score=9.27 TRINITY_DN117301_c0_g1_i1:47-409(+)
MDEALVAGMVKEKWGPTECNSTADAAVGYQGCLEGTWYSNTAAPTLDCGHLGTVSATDLKQANYLLPKYMNMECAAGMTFIALRGLPGVDATVLADCQKCMAVPTPVDRKGLKRCACPRH